MLPIGLYVSPGTYWIGFGSYYNTSPVTTIYYASGGADKFLGVGGAWIADGPLYTIYDTANNYSIKASLIY